ncbi:MAG TPA: GDP-mannose 4,6-dehydratase [Anaerolineales bacterium]
MMEENRLSSKLYRALITGGAGFIGSHLAEALLSRGHHVTVIDNLSTGRFENIQHLIDHPRFRFAIDTITNEVVMDRLVSECDVIFHLAAAVGVMLIVEKPVHTIETNVMGTEAVLKAALRYRAKVLIASTSEVYGKGNHIPFREDDDVVLGPTSRNRWAYAASKMVDEFLALAYHREKGLPVVVYRLFNTVGPRQTGRYGMVIPRFVQQALRGDTLEVYGDGQQSRCFLHVTDAVDAILALADCTEAVGEVFNIGSVEEITIDALARRILDRAQQITKKSENVSRQIKYVPYDQAYAIGFEDMRQRVPEVTKIAQYTGWKPKRSLEQILLDILEDTVKKSTV